MELACIKSNVKCFTQANNSEAMHESLTRKIRVLPEKKGANEILQGKFDTTGLFKYMIEFIQCLEVDPTKMGKFSKKISIEEYKKAWGNQKVRTKSNSRGLSFSHYKAALFFYKNNN